MNGLRAVYHLALADYLERTRRLSFLVILGLTILTGYFYLPANAVSNSKTLAFTLAFGGPAVWYRGVYNSAWVGTQVALFATLGLSLAGFYLVKNTIGRDTRTGVGQIIATTSLRRVQYTLGKLLSNFAVLATMVMILAVVAGVMQLLRGEDTRIYLWALLSPFVFMMLPTMAVVAAMAILFETVAWLRGTFGNITYREVGAYALIPQPEQAPNESKRAIAEIEENVKANERKEAMQMRDLQEHVLK